MTDERTPLLWSGNVNNNSNNNNNFNSNNNIYDRRSSRNSIGNSIKNDSDKHRQFCMLVGIPATEDGKQHYHPPSGVKTLYGRAIRRRNTQTGVYIFTATLSNTLLLTQVVLGAALTALGASESSHILITIFGALNTIIAGLVAYLKSRGQPMRARMFRDDLDRVVDEIENSETMWLGISRNVHGYDEIAIDDSVSVRSEVARLTRLYDKAVRSNTMNDPDMYMNAVGEGAALALRSRPAGGAAVHPVTAVAQPIIPPTPGPAILPAIAAPIHDPDESPATKAAPPKEEKKKEEVKEVGNGESSSTNGNGNGNGNGNDKAKEKTEGDSKSGESANGKVEAVKPLLNLDSPDDEPATKRIDENGNSKGKGANTDDDDEEEPAAAAAVSKKK